MNEFFQELLRFGVYKKTQGRITRQVTFFALAITIGIGLWRVSEYLRVGHGPAMYFGLPAILLALGWWITFRAVNYPAFADFLVAVEAEMAKVSWPTRSELIRASCVVLVSLIILGGLLAGFDLFWIYFFRAVGIY